MRPIQKTEHQLVGTRTAVVGVKDPRYLLENVEIEDTERISGEKQLVYNNKTFAKRYFQITHPTVGLFPSINSSFTEKYNVGKGIFDASVSIVARPRRYQAEG